MNSSELSSFLTKRLMHHKDLNDTMVRAGTLRYREPARTVQRAELTNEITAIVGTMVDAFVELGLITRA